MTIGLILTVIALVLAVVRLTGVADDRLTAAAVILLALAMLVGERTL